jgi:membrane protease subunit HflC
MKVKLAVIAAIGLIGGLIYFSAFPVGVHEVVIVTRFGKPVRTVSDAGLHFKLPGFLENANRFDKRVDVFETYPTQLLLGDKNPIIISCFIAWAVEKPLVFFQSVGKPENAQQKLGDLINSRLSMILGDYSVGNIINVEPEQVKLAEIEEKIVQSADPITREKYGIQLYVAGIQRLAYPDVVVQAVYDRMKSERNKEADKIRAEGMEAANRVTAQADKEAREIKADAQKKALILKGEGDRKAMQIYSEAFSKDREFFDFLQSLETYSNILSEETTLILSTESELFRYFQLKDRKDE